MKFKNPYIFLTDSWMSKPKATCPLNFFKVGGIIFIITPPIPFVKSVYLNIFSYFSTKTYVVGTQKNVSLSQNIY